MNIASRLFTAINPNATVRTVKRSAVRGVIKSTPNTAEASSQTFSSSAGTTTQALDEHAQEKKQRGRMSQKDRNNSGKANVHVPSFSLRFTHFVYILVMIVRFLAALVAAAIFFFILGAISPLREVLPNFYVFVDGILWAFDLLCSIPFKLWHLIFG